MVRIEDVYKFRVLCVYGARNERLTDGGRNDRVLAARATAKRLKISTDGARLEDVRIHDLRRTLGSWQARTGASLVIIGKSLGHKSYQATAVYARLDTDPVRQAMETATSAILEAAGVKPAAKVRKTRRRTATRPAAA